MISKNATLEKYNNLGLAVQAEYLAIINSREDLNEAISFCKEKKLKFNIFGLGTNMLLTKKVLPGLTLIMKNKCFVKEGENFRIAAGEMLGPVIMQLDRANYHVTELAGFPSSIGGAIRGNAGTQGVGMGDFIINGEIINLEDGTSVTWQRRDFDFAYRYSKLKENPNLIFWEGIFHFPIKKGEEQSIKDFLLKRKGTQPVGQKSAGCFFKNPPQNSSGALIDKCGLKGSKIGGAYVSDIHGNFLLSDGTATPEDFQALIKHVQDTVYQKTGIELELEVQLF